MADAASDLLIKPITPDQTSVALELFRSRSQQHDWDQLFELILDDRLDEEEILVAERDNVVVGAIWTRVLTHNSGQIMAPVSRPDQNDVSEALLNHAIEKLVRRGIRFATCTVGPSDAVDELLQRAGFRFAANIQSMVCVIPSRRDDLPQGPENRMEIKPAESEESLIQLIAETYKGSLDCPIVNGYQDARDLVATNANTHKADQGGWYVARHLGNDIGCILISIEGNQAHVVYIGIVPHGRGRGWGVELLEFANQIARSAGANTVVADVDSKNAPAIAMYESLGYVAFDFNRVFYVSRSASRHSTSRHSAN